MTNPPSQFDRIMAMWREIDFPVCAVDYQASRRYVDHLAAVYSNGAVLHQTFAMPNHPEWADIMARGDLHAAYFFDRFWRSPSVNAQFPAALHELNFYDASFFPRIHPVELPGSLAAALVRGGAYGGTLPRARDALQLGMEAAEELLHGDFDDTMVFVSQVAWSRFFRDIAWDYTWLVMQPRLARIDVILATDTD